MRILDRYVTRNFLLILVGAAVAFLAIFVVVDLVEHMNEFIDQSAPWTAPVLYYLYYSPYIVVLTLPVAMLLASLSTVGAMSRDSELVALKASGVSTYRVIRTLAVLALVISGLAFVVGEAVVPRTNEQKAMIWNRYVDKRGPTTSTETVNRTLSLGNGQTLFVKRFNEQQGLALDILLTESDSTRPLRSVQATQMRYMGDGGMWEMLNVTVRQWEGENEVFQTLPALQEHLPAVTPAELAARRQDPEQMGFVELRDYVERNLTRGRDVTRAIVDLHMKVSLPFANFIIVLFGASLAAIRRRSGLAVGFAVSILICFVYYGVIRTGQALGYNADLPPTLAAWLGNIIFGVLSLFFLRRARF